MAVFKSIDVNHIPKFDGTNFSSWKFHVWLILRNCDLDDVVSGTDRVPAPIKDDDQVVTNMDAIKTWQRKDLTAQTIICSTVDQQSLKTIMNCRTSADMWSRLLIQHEQKAKENKYFLQEQFFSYVFEKASFRYAVSLWDSVPETERTIALLTVRLLKEETMNKLYGTTEELDLDHGF